MGPKKGPWKNKKNKGTDFNHLLVFSQKDQPKDDDDFFLSTYFTE